MARPLRVLMVEDSEDDAVLLVDQLRSGGFEPDYLRVDSAAAMSAALDQRTWDIVFADYTMPHFKGTDALKLLRKKELDLPFIFVSGTIGEDTAVEAMKQGAHDYIVKGQMKRLVQAVERELREAEVRRERKRAEEALQETHQMLQALIQSSPQAIVVMDPEGRIKMWNPAAERIFGWKEEEVLNRPLPIVPENKQEGFRSLRPTAQAPGDFTDVEVRRREKDVSPTNVGIPTHRRYPRWLRYRKKDGTPIDVTASTARMADAEGHTSGIMALFTDISERKQTEALLKVRARQQAAVAELGRYALASRELSALMNRSAALITQTLGVEYCKILELLPDGKRLSLRAGAGWREGSVGRVTVDAGIRSQAGYTLLCNEPVIMEDLRTETRFSGPPLLREHGVVSGMSVIIPGRDRPFGVLGAYTTRRQAFTQDDVHFLQAVANVLATAIERKSAEETIEHQAYHDPLTDLPNRTLFLDRLQRAILAGQREKKPIALMILDLDRFKEINDRMGHQTGDLLLKQISERLMRSLRESDTVARLGGDEFAIILPNVGIEGAVLTAQKIMELLESPFIAEGQSLDVGVSIGIALFPEHGQDADLLMRRADTAMYAAKQTGHGYAVFSREQDRQSPRNLLLMSELRHAIEREELQLHYQPKIDLRTGRVTGVEALARWRHPRRGLIPPDQFISLADRSGLIRPLTYWVLKTALRQCKAWYQQGLDVPVAVNLSTRNLQDPELADRIVELLQKTGLPAGLLELEISENVVMEDKERVLEFFTRLSRLGVRFSIDDFGTGYYSLAFLKRLPLSAIKIDKSFVMEMMTDPDNAAIVRSTIALGHNLGLKVISEGVENRETRDKLTVLGCDLAQGYHISGPVPADDLTRWLRLRSGK